MKAKDPKKNKLGLREIASAANVSVATASRVISGSRRVAPGVQKAVLDALTTLDADFLQHKQTKTLVFIHGNQAMNPFHTQILVGAEAYCSAHGYGMSFLSFNYSQNISWKDLRLPKVVQRHDVQGVVLAGTTSTNFLELLEHEGIPFVVLGNNIIGELKDLKNDVIFSDETQGGQDITRYLIKLGHRHIGFVGNTRLPWFARCFAGYRRAMEEAGLTPRLSSIDSEINTEIGYLGAKSLLAQSKSVTAIFAGNDPTADGVYKALRDSGLRIPDDVSVVGCNDTIGACLYPELTTIREFPEQLGKHMVELLLNRIAKPDLEPQSVTIPTKFIERDSCCPINTSRESTSDEPQQEAMIVPDPAS